MRKYTPTYRGYETFMGYYNAMTEDHWTHVHSAGSSCNPYPDMAESAGESLRALNDNGTYECTLFGNRAVDIITAHPTSSPMFMYLAFHNEHDPHQAPLASVEAQPHIRSDTCAPPPLSSPSLPAAKPPVAATKTQLSG